MPPKMAEDSPILVVADVEEEDVAADVGERYRCSRTLV